MFVVLKKDYFGQKAGTTLDIDEPHTKSLLDQGIVEAVEGDPYGPLIAKAVATSIAKYVNPYLLHMPLPGMTHLPSFAFMTSPAEIERGAVYEFVLNHSVEVDRPDELLHTETELIQ